jgi:hypothetical protein
MPAEQGLELRISLQRLLIGLVLVIVPFSLVGLYITSQSDKSLERTIGNHFKIVAEDVGTEAAHFITDRVMDVVTMAIDPVMIDAVTAADRSYRNATDEAIATKFEKVEKTWNGPESGALIEGILSSSASRLLKRRRELDPRFLRITVTDARGATVAATDKPADYFQGNSDQWHAVYAQGKGALNITDVQHDEATKADYIAIGTPILEESSSRLLGAVNALVNVSSLLLVLNRDNLGPTVGTSLVKGDGTIISGPNVNLSMKLKSEEFAIVRDAMGTLEGRQTGYIVADMSSGRRKLVSFADTGLKRDYTSLGWIVMVSQDMREAMAPVRAIGRFALLMVIFSSLMVTLLAVYYFLHRKQQFADIKGAISD